MGVIDKEYSKPVSEIGEPKPILTLDSVFGYPPDNLLPITNKMIRKCFPVATFIPSIPHFENGLDLFTIEPAWGDYNTLLRENGYYSSNTNCIKVAFLADNFPTDTFTNEYGENFLQKFTDVASEGASSIAQMLGATSATQVFGSLRDSALKTDNLAIKGIGKGMEFVGDAASAAYTGLQSAGSVGNFAAGSLKVINELMAGSRIDFPMVWKSSSFQPSYSMTVRLYNPNPQSEDYTKKYIIGPIVALMLLATPRANDSSTFTWPFLHHIICPGLFELNPGFISNITIVKGGDQQQISFQNRLGMVDVRIDVGSLYSTMLAGTSKINSTRPTVKKYAEILSGFKDTTTREADNQNYEPLPGDGPEGNRNAGLNKFDALDLGRRYTPPTPTFNNASTLGRQRRPPSPKISANATGQPDIIDRVTSEAKRIYNEILDQLPALPF